jgi:hypothetical protein
MSHEASIAAPRKYRATSQQDSNSPAHSSQHPQLLARVPGEMEQNVRRGDDQVLCRMESEADLLSRPAALIPASLAEILSEAPDEKLHDHALGRAGVDGC